VENEDFLIDYYTVQSLLKIDLAVLTFQAEPPQIYFLVFKIIQIKNEVKDLK
jgi:hypothetical protein